MQKVLDSIFSIEKNAQKMVEDAQKECEDVYADAEKQREKLKEDILRRQNLRLEKIKKFEEEHANEKIKKITEESRSELDSIHAVYTKNKERWIDGIFHQVIGR